MEKLKSISSKKNSKSGFTMIEIIIVIGIMAILSIAGSRSFLGYRTRNILKLTGDEINSLLRTVHDRAVAQEESKSWGVFFRNDNNTSGYYVVFYGTSYGAPGSVTSSVKYLDPSLKFVSPGSNTSTSTVFSQLSGNTTNSSPVNIVVSLKSNSNATTSINIYSNGRIENF